MDEELRRGLERARRLILSADARLRFYAYVEGADEYVLVNARADWHNAESHLWDSIREKEQVVASMDAFANAAAALALLMDTLAVGLESPEELPPGTGT